MITASDVWEEQHRVMCPDELPEHRAMYVIDDPQGAKRRLNYSSSGISRCMPAGASVGFKTAARASAA